MTFTHTHAMPEPEWIPCATCGGDEGWMDGRDEWIACHTCDGQGGYLGSPEPTPSITIVELPPTR